MRWMLLVALMLAGCAEPQATVVMDDAKPTPSPPKMESLEDTWFRSMDVAPLEESWDVPPGAVELTVVLDLGYQARTEAIEYEGVPEDCAKSVEGANDDQAALQLDPHSARVEFRCTEPEPGTWDFALRTDGTVDGFLIVTALLVGA